MYKKLMEDINKMWNEQKIQDAYRYFKVWPWTYSEWDIFIGTTSADEREIFKKYKDKLSFKDLDKLLNSKIHEHRRVALNILRYKFEKAKTEEERKTIYDLAFNNKHWINNWDLVDIFVPHVFGGYLYDKDRSILDELVISDNLWDRRIAIMSTMYFIREWDFNDTLRFAEILLWDKEDLIHKASGWMLREIGKRDIEVLYDFLDKHHKEMPRTMLRYSIEKLTEDKRKHYMKR